VAYQSLYRRYRPGGFDDLVGQVPVVRTLSNAITEDRLHHAYLFTGPRGTGKTSIARILAKAVNCVDGPTPSPCGVCESCVAIAAGTSLDVIELDMASHGGVDDARDLRERAQFAPTTGRRKVYILDEVHMASTAAFNALLKLIEEPPSHVMFAMATTDPQKVLPTILSRVQRLDLRRVDAEAVAAHVVRIVTAEGASIEEAAVDAVVRAGDGSVRDTLSILEQVLAFAGGDVTAAHVAQVLGSTPSATVTRVVDLLGAGDLAGLLTTVAQLVDEGHDLRRFTLDLVAQLRDLLVLQAAPEHPELVDATREHRAVLVEQAGRLARERVLHALETLAATVVEQRQGTPRLPLELALAQLVMPRSSGAAPVTSAPAAAAPAAAPTAAPSSAPAPVPAAEPTSAPVPAAEPTPAAAPEQAAPAPAPAAAQASEPVPSPDPAPEPARRDPDPAPVHAPEPDPAPAPEPDPAPPSPGSSSSVTLETVVARWDAVVELVRQASPRAKAIFEPAVPIRLVDGILTLSYGPRYSSFHAEQAERDDMRTMLRDALQRACSLDARVNVVRDGEDQRSRPSPPLVNDPDGPSARALASEAQDVAEADAAPTASVDPRDLGQLLADRLDATPEP
jgi:DNA polymerase III subunit gamma/tau